MIVPFYSTSARTSVALPRASLQGDALPPKEWPATIGHIYKVVSQISVRCDVLQELSDDEKARARANIGAAASPDAIFNPKITIKSSDGSELGFFTLNQRDDKDIVLPAGVVPSNAKVTLTANGETVGFFTANQASDKTIDLPVPSDHRITVKTADGTVVGSFTLNQGTDSVLTLPAGGTATGTGRITLAIEDDSEEGYHDIGSFTLGQVTDSRFVLPRSGGGGGSVPGNGTVTVKAADGSVLGSFTLNQSADSTVTIPGGSTVNDAKVTVVDGSDQEIASFTLNQAQDTTVKIPKSVSGGANNSKVTIVDADGNEVSSFTLNQESDAEVKLPAGATVNDSTVVLKKTDGTVLGSFTLNQASTTPIEISIPSGGGGGGGSSAKITVNVGSYASDSFTLDQSGDKTLNLNLDDPVLLPLTSGTLWADLETITGTTFPKTIAGAFALLANAVNLGIRGTLRVLEYDRGTGRVVIDESAFSGASTMGHLTITENGVHDDSRYMFVIEVAG